MYILEKPKNSNNNYMLYKGPIGDDGKAVLVKSSFKWDQHVLGKRILVETPHSTFIKIEEKDLKNYIEYLI